MIASATSVNAPVLRAPVVYIRRQVAPVRARRWPVESGGRAELAVLVREGLPLRGWIRRYRVLIAVSVGMVAGTVLVTRVDRTSACQPSPSGNAGRPDREDQRNRTTALTAG
jgi:hypothetical protein